LQGFNQPGHDAREQLIRLQVHGRPRQPRVALVQERGAHQAQAAGRLFQQLSNDRLGGRVPGQRVQVTLDNAGSQFLVYGQDTRRTRQLRPIYQFCCPPAPPRFSAGREAGKARYHIVLDADFWTT
jgi:hypothetical protein